MEHHLQEAPPPPSSTGSTFGVFIALALVVFAVVWFVRSGPGSALAAGGWSGDWEAAVESSRASGRPAIVLVTADWCPACRTFEAEVLARSDVSQYLRSNFTPVVLDVSDPSGPNAKRAAELHVDGVPTLILYSREGREIGRRYGMPAEAFLDWLRVSTGR